VGSAEDESLYESTHLLDLDSKEEVQVAELKEGDSTGELVCPNCNRRDMEQMGTFGDEGEGFYPHMRCQQCWADAIFIHRNGAIWRSKEERLESGNRFMS
jgi:hypothetical protein